mmetsp:Transcript_11212/g.35447  ORF Transcript_11212/g.35447 Transcript_11212/m.35447 type:complete len:235 (-) Transcript_11212:5-709(-)
MRSTWRSAALRRCIARCAHDPLHRGGFWRGINAASSSRVPDRGGTSDEARSRLAAGRQERAGRRGSFSLRQSASRSGQPAIDRRGCGGPSARRGWRAAPRGRPRPPVLPRGSARRPPALAHTHRPLCAHGAAEARDRARVAPRLARIRLSQPAPRPVSTPRDRVRCLKGAHKGKVGETNIVKDGKVKVKFDPTPPSDRRDGVPQLVAGADFFCDFFFLAPATQMHSCDVAGGHN